MPWQILGHNHVLTISYQFLLDIHNFKCYNAAEKP